MVEVPGAQPDNPIQDNDPVQNDEQVQESRPGTSDTEGLVTCSGLDCDMCSFVGMVEKIIDWLIGIMLVIFAIVTAVAGFRLVISGGNPEAKTKAKEMLTNAFIGIVIVLTAWLLIDTLMRAILPSNGEIKGGPWSSVQCYGQVKPGEKTDFSEFGESEEEIAAKKLEAFEANLPDGCFTKDAEVGIGVACVGAGAEVLFNDSDCENDEFFTIWAFGSFENTFICDPAGEQDAIDAADKAEREVKFIEGLPSGCSIKDTVLVTCDKSVYTGLPKDCDRSPIHKGAEENLWNCSRE
jgi:hypothetical protein